MINTRRTSPTGLPAGSSILAYKRAEPTCPYCSRRLQLCAAPIRVPAGYRLEPTHSESGERDVSRFGQCGHCCLVFEDVNTLMAVYEQVRQRILLAGYRVRRARELFDGGRGNARVALRELASAFPCLEGQPGVRPFSAPRLKDWMCETALSASERDCALFVLHVADAASGWAQHFDVVAALERWDPVQRAVFIEWAKAPWWA
jgi:hypothetical protein